MNRATIGYVSFGIFCVAFAGFSIFLSSKLSDYQGHLDTQRNTISGYQQSISNLEGIIDKYQIENEILADSILLLNETINDLVLRIDEQDKIISTLRKKLNKTLRSFQDLESEIARLEAEKKDNSLAIASLEEEKNMVLKEYSETQVKAQMQEETKQKLEEATAENIQMVLAERKRLVIEDIAANTVVNYSQVKLGKKPNRANTNKIFGQNKWNYTTFEFTMDHRGSNKEIIDQEFILKIVDKDSGEILPYNEGNRRYPDSEGETEGWSFNFVDNPVKALHVNFQSKIGKKYEARIFLVKEGKEYMLANSTRLLVENGKAIN